MEENKKEFERLSEEKDNNQYIFEYNSTEKCDNEINMIYNEFIMEHNKDLTKNIFFDNIENNSLHKSIHVFKSLFFKNNFPLRTTKHISDPYKGSACKRINMFLRWMVRKDSNGVDFGIWNKISPSYLSCPLDVHSGRVARKLGMLKRTQNDHKAVIELDNKLRIFDSNDPVKYDFCLTRFGIRRELSMDDLSQGL
ncbi:DUF2400 domain-containing protein [Desulfobacula sp.]|uniref:DUF2400 domain-containing protein n=1 Tax=Desulfobacula sp. TaxID=2593537 RepID=UPI0039B8D624